ncbi:apolipoprotein N-acyltransferase [Sanguibacter suaedae]|uniref:Apolipoprotein N-acyltransferase n=1 Tax=Sanguibacter suaedae TaxID=2795737 RepID=A0A934IFQ3_9MICO|nr:apolipoprotein N-acyltransferase [Sanguibacter suaedae]MBI9116154.1 apolipoprotein N-acyltransferase [Sanguibacter suaedae]
MLPHHTPRLLTLALAVAGGLLTNLGFPDTGVWIAAIAGVTVLYVATRRDSPWWNALVGLVFGLTFFLVHIRWAQYAVGDVPWVALSTLEAAFVALFALVWTWVRRIPVLTRSRALHILTFATLWVAAELFRSAAPFGGFPWGRLAFSQAESPLGRLAWLGGAPLVSFAVAALGVLLALTFLALVHVDAFGFTTTLVSGALVLAAGFFVPLDTQAQSGTLRIGAVQGNVATPGLNAFDRRREVLDNHVAGTHALLDRVEPGELDVVLWPENGTDIDPQVDAAARAAIDGAARAVGAPLLLGAQEYPEDGGRYNVSLMWEPGVGVTDRYAKQHPAPFAEYIPIRDLVRPFSDAVDLVTTDMLPGTQVGTVTLDSERLGRTVLLGDAICFEVAYDTLVRESVAAGAEMLVIPTNNASFGPTEESTQQLAMSRLRAIETGRATVQISTVGVSAVIAPNGVVTHRTGHFTAEQMIATVNLRTTITPAVHAGQWPARVLLFVAVFLLGAATLHARRPSTPSTPTTSRPPRGTARTTRTGRSTATKRPATARKG